jgi:hypothetical protein
MEAIVTKAITASTDLIMIEFRQLKAGQDHIAAKFDNGVNVKIAEAKDLAAKAAVAADKVHDRLWVVQMIVFGACGLILTSAVIGGLWTILHARPPVGP